MKSHSLRSALLFAVVSCCWFDPATAATTTQSATLHPGWNAVFLEVEPESTAPADVFAGIADLVSVWRWVPSTSTVEFVQDETNPIPKGSQWLIYDPAQPAVSNLHAIHGETAYLVNLGGSSDVPWIVTGEPALPQLDWKTSSFNFVGFHLNPGAEPFFGDFFSSSPAHDGQKIFLLDPSGDWQEVADPPTTRMRQGEGFWVYCDGSSQFTGPISVQPDQSGGLHYGKKLSEQNLMLRNVSAGDKTLWLLLSSLTDTVYYWVFEPDDEVAGWTPFPSPLGLAVPAAGSQRLRLGVKRAGLEADTAYEANLTVIDGAGMRILVPVSVTGIGYTGLWVGDATITKVNQPADPDDPDTPVATGSELSFRLVLHADAGLTARLLSQVIQLWHEGTLMPDPEDLGKLIVDQPGDFVLLTDDALVASYSGAAMRDGQLVGRRISSPAFPSLMTGQEFDDGYRLFDPSLPNPDDELRITVDLPQDDPTNPFRHLYHPDHQLTRPSDQITDQTDGTILRVADWTRYAAGDIIEINHDGVDRTVTFVNEGTGAIWFLPPYGQTLEVGALIFNRSWVDPARSYDVTREITLTFADEYEGRPITGVPALAWGSSEVGGIYRETITGLHKDPLKIEGTFLLHKASDVDTLTTTPAP